MISHLFCLLHDIGSTVNKSHKQSTFYAAGLLLELISTVSEPLIQGNPGGTNMDSLYSFLSS